MQKQKQKLTENRSVFKLYCLQMIGTSQTLLLKVSILLVRSKLLTFNCDTFKTSIPEIISIYRISSIDKGPGPDFKFYVSLIFHLHAHVLWREDSDCILGAFIKGGGRGLIEKIRHF